MLIRLFLVVHCLIVWGLFSFLFQGPIDREVRTTVRIRWSFAQMCCAMSLVCPSIAIHCTCQFWACSEPVNMPKTVVSRQIWSACCNSIPLFQNKRRGMLSSCIVLLHDNTRLHTAAATYKCFRWEAFDHPPSSTRTCSLWFSSLSSHEMVVGQHFGTVSYRPA